MAAMMKRKRTDDDSPTRFGFASNPKSLHIQCGETTHSVKYFPGTRASDLISQVEMKLNQTPGSIMFVEESGSEIIVSDALPDGLNIMAKPAKKIMQEICEAKEAKAAAVVESGILREEPLVSPALLLQEIPCPEKVAAKIQEHRRKVADVICGRDDRLLVVIGPCSIHDVEAAKVYAGQLANLAQELDKDLVIVMRTYFEKPRTTVGWKGLINDPKLNGSFDINTGLRTARQLLLDVNAIGLPCSLEFLDTISPRYISDLITWGAIGARTTECQLHRELVSSLAIPVGFKNSTDGGVKVATDAMQSASSGHSFMSINDHGLAAIVHSRGNKECHVIHRGGAKGPNYAPEYVQQTTEAMQKAKMPARIMVDCSHGNSQKKHENQLRVAASICAQLTAGCKTIIGVMIESNINAGNQKVVPGQPLRYGVSITDACIDWESTVQVLRDLAEATRTRRSPWNSA